MTAHCFLTAAFPIANERVGAVEAALDTLGNPAKNPVYEALDRPGCDIHFLSMSVVPADTRHSAILVLEGSIDGSEEDALAILQRYFDPFFQTVLDAAGIPSDSSAARTTLLRSALCRSSQGLFARPGLNFSGTPGMSYRQIRDDYLLSVAVKQQFLRGRSGSALEVLQGIRRELDRDPKISKLIETAEPLAAPRPAGELSLASLAPAAIVTFGWPFLALGALLAIAAGVVAFFAGGWGYALLVGFVVLLAVALAGIVGAWLIYQALRKAEKTDRAADAAPEVDRLRQVIQRENFGENQQNHLFGISTMKPGLLRALTLRIAFWLIAKATETYRPGYLGELGTIHFARWILLPGTDKLLFLSNYGGSWESYLEDFITKASMGLTAVWSNTEDYPRTRNLFLDGATDGDRFKRWARRQQHPTRFWFSHYTYLTTDRIRTNALLRHGLKFARTEDEASAWLTCIGSKPRPAGVIETNDVQKLLFGGLGPLGEAECLLVRLSDRPQEAQTWLSELEISFGEGPLSERERIVGLTAAGLGRLGVSQAARNEFPIAFVQGMASETRSRILKDTSEDSPDRWIWGHGDKAVDAVLLVYCRDADSLQEECERQLERLRDRGGSVVHRIRMESVRRNEPTREPFGFVDGISQPMIRGTRLWTPDAPAMHVVAPGEFILGYPDDRGFPPPSPTVAASEDPLSRLPSVERTTSATGAVTSTAGSSAVRRDFGCNGSFLVIRQLRQDVEGFRAFTKSAAEELTREPRPPGALPGANADQMEEWVAAKMVGRWKDGTSLVRNPVHPGGGWPVPEGSPTTPPVVPDNTFRYGAEDPMGHRCPFGAHVRRTNPRDSMHSGEEREIPIVNRHRILRVGRPYARPPGESKEGIGLLFMCLNADVERQFEFVQQTWAMARQFHGLDGEVDSVIGRGNKGGRLTIPTPEGPLVIQGIQDYVDVLGGAYFFLPSRRALRFLAGSSTPPSSSMAEIRTPALDPSVIETARGEIQSARLDPPRPVPAPRSDSLD